MLLLLCEKDCMAVERKYCLVLDLCQEIFFSVGFSSGLRFLCGVHPRFEVSLWGSVRV